jgi:hypothetical protein
MTPKQAVVTMVVVAILWLPAMIFIIWFRQGFSPRQMGAIGGVNMLVGMSLLIWIYRKWIRNIK